MFSESNVLELLECLQNESARIDVQIADLIRLEGSIDRLELYTERVMLEARRKCLLETVARFERLIKRKPYVKPKPVYTFEQVIEALRDGRTIQRMGEKGVLLRYRINDEGEITEADASGNWYSLSLTINDLNGLYIVEDERVE